MKPVNVGIIGLGNVGSGTVQVLQDHAEEIAARLGFPVRLKAIYSRRIAAKELAWIDPQVQRTSHLDDILEDPEIDIVVELIGGIDPAKTIVMKALSNKKSVVTANKALLAEWGVELMEAARANAATLGIEAAVAGSIPILRVIQEGLVGERILSIYGILNGTSNYILTEMEKSARPFSEILKEAQRLGYAEADPTLDVEGFDARDKLAILAMMCFGEKIHCRDIDARGISNITPLDFKYAHRLGSTIKLIAVGQRLPDGKLALSVRPTLIPRASILAKVDGAFNAILIRGAKSGDSMYYGRGAGGSPTGIAVVSDIIAVARNLAGQHVMRAPPLGYQEFNEPRLASKEDFIFGQFLRFVVKDRLGIIAELGGILAKYGINIHSVFQEPYQDKDSLPFVITVEKVPEAGIERAIAEMQTLEFLKEKPLVLRIDEMRTDDEF